MSTEEGTHRNFFVFVTLKVQLSLNSQGIHRTLLHAPDE